MPAFVASATAINPATTSANSLTVNKPTGTLDGHLMIMIVSCSAAQTLTTPTGWTLVQGPFDSGSGVRSYLFKKVAASEGTNYTLTFVNSEACSVSIATFSGASDISDYYVNDNQAIDPATGGYVFPSTQALGYHVVAWRDTTINTASASGVTEAFDIGALGTGSVNARGQAGYYNTSQTNAYGAIAGIEIDITNSITASVVWDIAIGGTVPTNESWNATGTSVEMQAPSGWVDVTNDVLYDQGINITRGTTSQGGQVNPSMATFRLNNNSGNYSPLNPLGTFYGVEYSTPCRISKTFGDINYQTPGYDNISYGDTGSSRVKTASSASLNITGDIDIRIECEPETWNQQMPLVAKWAMPPSTVLPNTTASWLFYLNSNGSLSFIWNDGADPSVSVHTVTSTAVVPTVIRQYLRVTLDVNNGASGSTATFYTSTDGSSWTQLGDTVVSSGTTSIVSSNAPVTIGAAEPGSYIDIGLANIKDMGPDTPFTTDDGIVFITPVTSSFVGKIYNASIRNGIAGTVVASPTFTSATNGSYSLTDSQSNLWIVVGPGVFTNRHYRHHGEITSWPQPRDTTGNFAWVDIESSGVLQRETQGTEEDLSLFYQHYTNPDGIKEVLQVDPPMTSISFFPHSYWPCEDDADSDAPTSAFTDGVDAEVDGTVEFAASDFNPSSKAIMKIENGTSVKFPTPGSVTGGYAVEFVLYAPTGMTSPSDILHIQTTGTDAMFRLVYSGTNQISASIYDANGTLIDNVSFVDGFISQRKVRISVKASFGEVAVSTMTMGDRVPTETSIVLNNGTGVSGRITAAFLEPNATDGVYVGHMAIFDGTGPEGFQYGSTVGASIYNDPLNGLISESADRRAKRIVNYREMLPYPIGDSGKKMGRQYPDVPMGFMRSCQETDDGYVYEPRNFLGLGYRTISSMYNTAPVLELDYAGNQLSGTFDPIKDNLGVTNDVTVNNVNLGSQRFEKTSGVNNINRPPNGAGRYSSSADVSLARTSDALNQASWRVFLGTNNELKINQVTVALENLNYNTGDAAIQKFLTADIGDSMTIDNLPDLLMPDQMRQIIVGYSETFDQFQHSITFNTVPGSPYQPLELTPAATSTTQSKAGSAYTTLNEDLDTTETGVDVAIESGRALWTTSGVDFDIMIEGERMTVTSVSGASSPQTFTVTRSVNGVVKTHSTGASVKLFKPRHAGL